MKQKVLVVSIDTEALVRDGFEVKMVYKNIWRLWGILDQIRRVRD